MALFNDAKAFDARSVVQEWGSREADLDASAREGQEQRPGEVLDSPSLSVAFGKLISILPISTLRWSVSYGLITQRRTGILELPGMELVSS